MFEVLRFPFFKGKNAIERVVLKQKVVSLDLLVNESLHIHQHSCKANKKQADLQTFLFIFET